MIHVLTRISSQQHIQSITIEGHADSAPHGQDLVCAAVSAVGVGTLNALGFSPRLKLTNQEGLIKIEVLKPLTEKEHIILETMLIQLKTIETSHAQYIQLIQRKEN